jgi:hypothetical protein
MQESPELAIIPTPYLPPKSGFIAMSADIAALTKNSPYFAAMLRFGNLPKYIRIPEIATAATDADMRSALALMDDQPLETISDATNYYTLYQLLEYYLCDDLLDKYVAHLKSGVLCDDYQLTADQLVQIHQIDAHRANSLQIDAHRASSLQIDDQANSLPIDDQANSLPIVAAIFSKITRLSDEFMALGESLKRKLYDWSDATPVSVMDVLRLLQYWRDYVVCDTSVSDASLFLPYLCSNVKIFRRVVCTSASLPAISSNVAPNRPVIVSLPAFIQTFSDESRHIFDNMNWDNVIVAGGYVLRCLLPQPAAITAAVASATGCSGDIDLFVYGATDEIRRETFRRVVLYFAPHKTYYAVNGAVTTLCIVGVPYNIQIILTGVESIADVLEDFDLDYVQCAYNGVVYMTIDCMLALKQQCVIRTNGGPANKRVIKAYLKGFSISKAIGLARTPDVFYRKLRKYKKRGSNAYYLPPADVSDNRNMYLIAAIFKGTKVYVSADKLLSAHKYEQLASESEYFAGAARQNAGDIIANMVLLPHGAAMHQPTCGGRPVVFKTNVTGFDQAGVTDVATMSIMLAGSTLDLVRQLDAAILNNVRAINPAAVYEPIVCSYMGASGERFYMVADESAGFERNLVYANNNAAARLADVRRFAAYI